MTSGRTNTSGAIDHPEIAQDGAFQVLVWEEDVDLATNAGPRIYASTRCGGTSAWSAPEILRTPSSDSKDQSILFANPHVVLNRDDNIIHVVFLEVDTTTNTSEAWWARKAYTDCP